MRLIKKTWDSEDIESGGALLFKEIPTRPCTEQDFAKEPDSSLFYETKDTSVDDFSTHWRKFKCIEPGYEFEMFGNYDT